MQEASDAHSKTADSVTIKRVFYLFLKHKHNKRVKAQILITDVTTTTS